MAIPAIPTGLSAQQGNAQVLLTWNQSTGSTTYTVQRSTDGATYSTIGTVGPLADPFTTDLTVTVGTNYYYQVSATNASGTSSYCSAVQIVPTNSGTLSLGSIRLMAQQRADRENSQFVTDAEWNSYINQSAFELYDLLISAYGDEYYATSSSLSVTAGVANLPSNFYKVMGIDLNVGSSSTVTLKRFNFQERNRYNYPQQIPNIAGYTDLRYRLFGNTVHFIPTPSNGQALTLWYVPRMVTLLQDTDILDGVSGWIEYIIIDAAIKALQKEESDVSALMMQKQAMLQRIENMSQNRDIGNPMTITNSRAISGSGDDSMDYSGGRYW